MPEVLKAMSLNPSNILTVMLYILSFLIICETVHVGGLEHNFSG